MVDLPEETVKRLERATEKLNKYKTVSGIASMLEREGIKGNKGEPGSCPIAVYLTKESGVSVRFGITTAWVKRHPNGSNSNPAWEKDMNRVVTEFASLFDEGNYPQLDAMNNG